MEFDYFYGPEDAEQYQFYRIPKLLITSEQFKDISVEAKFLYGLMLDRLSLSIKNGWFDSLNRAYFIYTIEDVMEDMHCRSQKACKLVSELEKNTGLITGDCLRQKMLRAVPLFLCMEEEMAATRLIALHVNKGKTVAQCLNERLDYSQNPVKTEKGELISSYACDPETAAMEFLLSKRQYQQVTGQEYEGNIIAYQIRQSFKPGEITPEEANRLGYELAIRFTKGNHAFTVSTHTDRAHIHNHIIFNSTTLDCSRKFKNFFFSGIALQRLSDIVCFEHGYSIIERKPYTDRTKRTEYPKRHTVRNEIRSVLDELIRRKPKDWEEFLRLLAEEGYEIKRGKNIATKGRAQQRFVRLKSLGEDYTEDALKEKISRANVRDSHRQTQQSRIDLLIDIQNRALGKGAGYERWAKGFNLKQTAKTLLFLQHHDIHSYEDLERMTNEAVTGADQLLASIKEKDARIKEIEALRQHIFDYSKTRKIYLEYKRLPKAKKAEFYELHRAEIELQEAARAAFDQLPDGTKLPTVKELNAERTRLIRERQAEYAEYRKVKADRTEFIRAKQNADVILNRQFRLEQDHEKQKCELPLKSTLKDF